MTEESGTPWAPAKQKRSRRTKERIVAAALELLREKEFEEMTVADIAHRAGVSVGGFYARFPGKEALLQYFNGTVLDGAVDRAQELFSPRATSGLRAGGIVHRYIEMAVNLFRHHEDVLRQVALRSRTSKDPGFRERIRGLNKVLHDLFRERLGEHLGEMKHPDPLTAIDIALTAASGAMREYVLFQESRPQFADVDDSRLITELTDMFCSYIGVDR